MYKLLEIEGKVRVPPELFGKDISKAVENAIRKRYEGVFDKKIGLIIDVVKVLKIGEGSIFPGDGAIYYDVSFEILVYQPMLHEVVNGKVVQITENLAFIRVGPIDGTVHKSQIMDDYVTYSKSGVFQGKETKYVLKKGDKVRCRIIGISTKDGLKVGLTMRQPK